MTDSYLRPDKILGTYSRHFPDAWKQVDEFRARRKEIGDWADWCFLPLAGTYAIVSRGRPSRRRTRLSMSASWAHWQPGV